MNTRDKDISRILKNSVTQITPVVAVANTIVTTLTCPICGTKFARKHNAQKYCSSECSEQAHRMPKSILKKKKNAVKRYVHTEVVEPTNSECLVTFTVTDFMEYAGCSDTTVIDAFLSQSTLVRAYSNTNISGKVTTTYSCPPQLLQALKADFKEYFKSTRSWKKRLASALTRWNDRIISWASK